MPWCHNCITEYRDGIDKCADCGSELHPELPVLEDNKAPPECEWPIGENGEPEPLAALGLKQDGDFDYSITVSLLTAYGIPIRTAPASNDVFARVMWGGNWSARFGYDLFVPESRLQEARDILNAEPIIDSENE